MSLSQDNRLIEIKASFLSGEVIATDFHATEKMSAPFSMEVSVLCDDLNLSSKDVIGQKCSITLYPEGSDSPRYFHGRVSNFLLGDISGKDRTYRLRLVPGFWFLNQSSQHRIFEEMSAKDIINSILSEHGAFCSFEDNTSASFQTRQYVVQYGETDFQFVSRLMEEEGIYYYFKYTSSDHTMVLGDDTSAYHDCAEDDVKFNVGSDFDEKAKIMSWSRELQYHAGAFEQTDYSHETPKNFYKQNIATKNKFAQSPSQKSLAEFSRFTQGSEYSYDVGNNKRLTQICLESLEAGHDVAQGNGICGSFTTGGRFNLEHHIKSECQQYVITEVQHSARDDMDSDSSYSNQFRCIPAKVGFRPPQVNTKNIMRGPLNAKVVELMSSESKEDADPNRMVKVQFPWSNPSNSCWLRVVQSYAGAGWGASFVPRLEQEVLVDFISGDPDRPLVIGALYNKDNQGPKYTTTQSGFKTQASQFNELRFDDKKDAEEIYVEAGKDYNYIVHNDETGTIENDQKLTVIQNRTITISEGDESKTLDSGNQTLSVAGNQTNSVDGNQETTVKGNQKDTVKGSQTIAVTGSIKESSKASIESKATQSIKLQANTSIELKVGGNSIKIDQTGVTIKGTMVKIEGSAMTEVKSSGILKMQGSLVQIN